MKVVASGFSDHSRALTGRPPPLRMLWVTAAWGTCFLGVRWGLRDAPLLWFAALRALVGGTALAGIAAVQHRPLPHSPVTWAGTLMVRHLRNVDVVVASAAHFLFGGAVLAGVAAVTEGFPRIEWTPRFITALAFLGLVGTAAAFLAWFVEAQRCALASLTTWTFLVPVFGLLLGIAVLGERPDGWTVSGIALVLLSMRVALDRSSHHHPVRLIPLESR